MHYSPNAIIMFGVGIRNSTLGCMLAKSIEIIAVEEV